ncbi:hypothetical protein [Roseococcus sp.]|uniref:hypothetical protein n=1 Tax=Roseococcus sp. TaxID=2109646 RepID=UPI003BAC52F3
MDKPLPEPSYGIYSGIGYPREAMERGGGLDQPASTGIGIPPETCPVRKLKYGIMHDAWLRDMHAGVMRSIEALKQK